MLERAEDVRVVTFANLVDIRLDQTRGRVEAFACRTLEGTTFRVNAGRYVLALGGVENARVLLASRSQQREGVANGHDVVGRYFMEHPHYYGSIGVVHASALDLSFYRRGDSDWKRADGTPVQMLGALALSDGGLAAREAAQFLGHVPGGAADQRTEDRERRAAGGDGAGARDPRPWRVPGHAVDGALRSNRRCATAASR